MNIQAKHTPGDKVYYIGNGKIESDTVIGIQISVQYDRSEPGTKPVTRVNVLYGLDQDRAQLFNEAQLFTSVSELQKSIAPSSSQTDDKGA